MSNKLNSRMLAAFIFSSLAGTGIFLTQNAIADECGAYGTEDVKNATGAYIRCTENGVDSIIDVQAERARWLGIKRGRVHTIKTVPISSLSAKQLLKYGLTVSGGSSGGLSGGPGGSGGNDPCGGAGNANGGGRIDVNGGGSPGGSNGGSNNGGRGGVVSPCNGGGVVISGGSGGGSNRGGRGGSGGGRVTVDPRISAQVDVDTLADLCPGSGRSPILDAIDDKNDEIKKTEEDLKRFSDKGDEDYYLPKLKGAAALSCREEYLQFVLNSDDSSGCNPKNLGVSNDDFCSLLSASDRNLNVRVKAAIDKIAGQGNQDACFQAIEKNKKPDGQLFDLMVKNPSCLAQLKVKNNETQMDCEALGAYVSKVDEYDSLRARLKALRKRSENSCKVASARDAAYFTDERIKLISVDCATNVASSCGDALLKAEAKLASLPAPYCAECNNRGAGACLYGGNCTSSLSKGAQLVNAIGGVAVPLGLGILNYAAYNKSLNACVAAYTQQVQQAQIVGLPPQSPSCGNGGFAMGGYGGIGGIGGIGGMGMGMGGMGFPGGPIGGGMGMGMGFPGGPIGGGIGIGIGGGIGGGMGMGFPGMGGGIYNAGGGIGGLGGLGAGGFYMGQGNMYGIQQQMYDAQIRMQAMAAQNMALQYGAMNNFGLAGNMMGSPYYGMGNMGMMGMGNMGVMGMGAYPGYGQGFNPYGQGQSFNAGISLNLPSISIGAGPSYGNYGYGQSPWLGTPPYYAGGGAGGGGCGYYMGIPCSGTYP